MNTDEQNVDIYRLRQEQRTSEEELVNTIQVFTNNLSAFLNTTEVKKLAGELEYIAKNQSGYEVLNALIRKSLEILDNQKQELNTLRVKFRISQETLLRCEEERNLAEDKQLDLAEQIQQLETRLGAKEKQHRRESCEFKSEILSYDELKTSIADQRKKLNASIEEAKQLREVLTTRMQDILVKLRRIITNHKKYSLDKRFNE